MVWNDSNLEEQTSEEQVYDIDSNFLEMFSSSKT